MVHKIIYVQKQSSRDVLQERRCTDLTGNELTEAQPCRSVISEKSLCNFLEIKPMHGRIPENPQLTRKTSLPRKTPLGDCSCMSK